MFKKALKLTIILSLSMMLFSCAKKLELEVTATLDGKPATEAKVVVDKMEEGVTDENGQFAKIMKKKPGREIQISLIKEAPGYRIEPWQESFIMKIPPKDGMDKYTFQVDFKATKYITLAVTEKGAPLEEASVKIGSKKVGTTDEKGEFVYDYTTLPQNGFRISVTKKGYSLWLKTKKVTPGQRLDIPLSKETVISIAALTDEYGLEKGISDVTVSIGKKKVGKTNAKGLYTYVYKGEPGKKVILSLTAPGYIPTRWQKTIVLEGRQDIQRFFYPDKPKPIRVGIYGYASNTPDEDITDQLLRIEEAVSNNLFSYLSFQEVPAEKLREKMKKAKIDTKRMTSEGWQGTSLIKTVDMIILGSVAQDGEEMTIETKVYTSGGKLILSQINTAEKDRDIKKIAKKIVRNVLDRFPFEGTVISTEDDRYYAINLGRNDYKIGSGMEFDLMSPVTDKSGRIKDYRNAGTLMITNPDPTQSWAEVSRLTKGEQIAIGDKVIRRLYKEEEMKADHSFILSAKGGLPPDVTSLQGVNIYLEDRWVGTTDSNGNASIPVRLGRSYDIVLYRHGYQRISNEIRIDRDKDVKEFTLEVNNAIFKVESQPSYAEILIDQEKIGKTPMLQGKPVNFGFHTVKLLASGEYRDWEEVMEFNEKVVDRTGNNKFVFFKDYLRLGEGAEKEKDIDAAIQSYSKAEREHPDYSIIRCNLGRLYMDEREDYDSAIREFENVLTLPENQQLIYKQFAVTYTNLGHAYYEKGDSLIRTDREAAAQSLAKAIQNLQVAKQNTRFFPNQHYDEAIHDTYYYLAIAYNKLYQVTRKISILENADLAWREYFDFFPQSLEEKSPFAKMRESAESYWTQIQDLI